MKRTTMKRATSRLLLLLLLTSFTAAPTLARGPEPARPGPEARGFLSFLWRSLADLLPALDKTLSTIDPDGAPAPETTGNGTDGLGTIDPNG